MAKQKGRDMLLKIDTGGGVFVTIGGMRARSMKINNAEVDLTTSDSVFSSILRHEGDYSVQALEIAGSGLWNDDAAANAVYNATIGQTKPTFQVIVPGLATFQFVALFTGLDLSGSHTDPLAFSATIKSTGDITITGNAGVGA
jgi:predicted secreted protein